MGAAVLLVLALASADAEPVSALVLPLRPEGTVSSKQAAGARFLLRNAAERGGVAKLLAESKDDQRQSDKCELDPGCLREIAELRGADVLLTGTVAAAPDGLTLKLLAVGSFGGERRETVLLQGHVDDDPILVDRAVRQLLQPAALRGALFVEGEEGSRVFVDGELVGTLPLQQQLNDVQEGEHEVVVTREGKELFRRRVNVVHGETTLVRAMLVDEGMVGSTPTNTDSGPPIAAVALVAGGGALVAGGVVCGVLSLFAAREAEARAKDEQLLLPRDEGLLFRGQALAWVANGLYLAGAVAIGAGAALFVLTPVAEEP